MHDEPIPVDFQRLKDAVVREAHRLRNEALWHAPTALWGCAARALVRLRVLRPARRESAAPPAG